MLSSTFRTFFICLALPITLSVSAANKKKEKAAPVPLYQGIHVGLDLLSPLALTGVDSYQTGIKADINLKNTYFPTLEVGRSHFDKTSKNGIEYQASGSYLKIGVNKAISSLGGKAENLFFIGAHYGYSAFSYDLNRLVYAQNYWGNDVSSLSNEHASVGWLELVTGIRVRVLGPISLGWTAQYKSTLNLTNGKNSAPAYIPGYGSNVKPNVGIAFHVYYELPF